MVTKTNPNTKNFKNLPALLNNLKGLHFLPLGGCEEIGMNCNLYCYQGQWIMIDNGVTFSRNPDGVLMSNIIPFIESIDLKTFKGLIITHAHEDHVGAVAHLWRYLKCPIYATPFTCFILRKKLAEARIPMRDVELHEVNLESRIQVGPFDVEFLSLTHSIPEPNAVFIRTAEGNIFHTGDWKIDPDPIIGKKIEAEKLMAIGREGVLALVCDSTNVFEEGQSGSELEVQKVLMKIVSECTGRVVIACFSSNQARIASCYEAAKATGRQICAIGYSLNNMFEASRYCGYLDVPLIKPAQAQALPHDQVLIVSTGSQAEPRAALTRMANDMHPDIQLGKGDTVIFSSRVIPGNQEAIAQLHNQLIMRGVDLITYRDKIHVSGHPCRDELRQMYEWLTPKISIPVHGEQMHLREHADYALELNVPYSIVPLNGGLYHFSSDGIKAVGQVPTGRLSVDGYRLVDDQGPVRLERKILFEAGILMATLALEKDENKLLNHKISSYGIFERLHHGPTPSRDQKSKLSYDFKKEKDFEHTINAIVEKHAKAFNFKFSAAGQDSLSEGAPASSSSQRHEFAPAKEGDLRAFCAGLQEDLLRSFRLSFGITPVVLVNIVSI